MTRAEAKSLLVANGMAPKFVEANIGAVQAVLNRYKADWTELAGKDEEFILTLWPEDAPATLALVLAQNTTAPATPTATW